MRRAPSALVVGVVSLSATGPAHADVGVGVGDTAPDSLGSDRNGDAVSVAANRGKFVVISFWASWCPYCLKELPILEGIQRTSGDAHIKVIAINSKENPALYRKLLAHFKDLQLAFTRDRYGAIGTAYGVTGLPHTVILDRDGRIAYVHVGYAEKTLDRIVDELNGLLTAPAAQPVAATPSAP